MHLEYQKSCNLGRQAVDPAWSSAPGRVTGARDGNQRPIPGRQGQFPSSHVLSRGGIHWIPDRRALTTFLRASSEKCTVVVSAEFARQFKPVPKDGNCYIVQDPNRLSVYHLIRADGTHSVLDQKKCRVQVEVRVKRHDAKPPAQPSRNAAKLRQRAVLQKAPATPPAICLIDISRVMLITGFKKSFIYARADFPAPVSLGSSRRAASRWIESEVIAWVHSLVLQRATPQSIDHLHCDAPRSTPNRQCV
jgi:predicted DNA-binding transcriptional regulator AlpA